MIKLYYPMPVDGEAIIKVLDAQSNGHELWSLREVTRDEAEEIYGVPK